MKLTLSGLMIIVWKVLLRRQLVLRYLDWHVDLPCAVWACGACTCCITGGTSEVNDSKANSDAFEYSEHLDEYARADLLAEFVTAGAIEHVIE